MFIAIFNVFALIYLLTDFCIHKNSSVELQLPAILFARKYFIKITKLIIWIYLAEKKKKKKTKINIAKLIIYQDDYFFFFVEVWTMRVKISRLLQLFLQESIKKKKVLIATILFLHIQYLLLIAWRYIWYKTLQRIFLIIS